MMRYALLHIFLLLNLTKINAQGDCPGICTTTGGTYTTVTGTQLELTAANRGCLTAGEASASYWFKFCFTTSGVFQFYIDPSGNRNDFDFAIWDVATCPPSTTPIRCSYAAVPAGGPCATCDYTGLGNGAVDLSETATGNGWLAPLNVTAGQCILLNINNFGNGSSVFTMNLTGTTASISCPVLPIELISFEGVNDGKNNVLTWITATETNNSHYILERSTDALNWQQISRIEGEGTVNTPSSYNYVDKNYITNSINYYRLAQYDLNNSFKTFNIVSIDNFNGLKPYLIKTVNMLGEEVDDLYIGIKINIYSDGSSKKVINIK